MRSPRWFARCIRHISSTSSKWIDDVYAEQIERPKLAAVAAGSFAIFGLLVCAAGLFSVLSLAVARGLSSVLAGIEVTDAASWIAVIALVTVAGSAAA